jgi:hypothetical protein
VKNSSTELAGVIPCPQCKRETALCYLINVHYRWCIHCNIHYSVWYDKRKGKYRRGKIKDGMINDVEPRRERPRADRESIGNERAILYDWEAN